MSLSRYATLAVGGLLLSAASALAGPNYTFATSEGVQPSNVGTVTLTQINNNTVTVLVDLNDTSDPAPKYGFINTGNDTHTPFVFTLAGLESGISTTFSKPMDGTYSFGTFSLSTDNSSATPYGNFGISINNTAGNGSGKAYYGDLEFTLTRASGLSTDDFIRNTLPTGAYFAADLTNGVSTTGTQAWTTRSTTNVPEPISLSLFGAGLLGLGVVSRKQKTAVSAAA